MWAKAHGVQEGRSLWQGCRTKFSHGTSTQVLNAVLESFLEISIRAQCLGYREDLGIMAHSSAKCKALLIGLIVVATGLRGFGFRGSSLGS